MPFFNRRSLLLSSGLSLIPRQQLHRYPLLIHPAPLLHDLHHGGLRRRKPLVVVRVLKHQQMIHHGRASSLGYMILRHFHERVGEVSLAGEHGILYEVVHHTWKLGGFLVR